MSALVLALVGCTENQLHSKVSDEAPAPALTVSPSRVDFGDVPIDAPAAAAVTVLNAGDVAVDITSVTVEGATSFTVAGAEPGLLAVDGTLDLLVTYAPAAEGEEADLVVESDDPGAPRLVVPLTGSAAYGQLVVDPNPMLFDAIGANETAAVDVLLVNEGAATLDVTSLVVTGDALSLASSPELPLSLAPGASSPVTIGFAPSEDGYYEGTLWAATDTPVPLVQAPIVAYAGAGTVTGQVCSPDGDGWVAGATVWVAEDADGDGVEEWRAEDTTDAEGRFELDPVFAGTHVLHVERGSWSSEREITTVGGEYELPEPECLDPDSARVAVVTGEYDSIEAILARLDIDYTAYDWRNYRTLLEDPDELARYDIVFFDCGMPFDWLAEKDLVGSNLAAFVAGGGNVYASDWAYAVVEAGWPGAMDVAGDDVLWDPTIWDGLSDPHPFLGVEGTYGADVLDPTMQGALGTSTASIVYDLGAWVVVDAPGPDTDVLVRGDVSVYDEEFLDVRTVPDVPLAILYQPGGTVIYTTFHNSAELTTDMEVALEEIILSL